jgi:recombinational DNA repair ATPase RecF
MNLDLTIHNWRCFGDISFTLPDHSFVISDENGKGKTSLLSALYSLYTGQPWIGTRYSDALKQNMNYFGLLTPYPDWSLTGQISPSGRLVTKYSRSDSFPFNHSVDYPSVFTYTPSDNNLFSLSRSVKLSHFDGIIGQVYSGYTKLTKDLEKNVKAKNTYIKYCFEQEIAGDEAMFVPITQTINRLSLEIWGVRVKFFMALQHVLPQFESWIQSPLKNWQIKHLVSFQDTRVYPILDDVLVVLSRDEISKLWIKERIIGKTMYGAQRDDISFVSGHTQSELSLSRGEMRLLILFLKSSAQKILKEIEPNKNVFWLLDDVFNEFDDRREDIVFEYILQNSQYSVVTSTRKLHIDLPKYSISKLVK